MLERELVRVYAVQGAVASRISMAPFTTSSQVSEDSLARHSSADSQRSLPLSLRVQLRVSAVVASKLFHTSEPLAG